MKLQAPGSRRKRHEEKIAAPASRGSREGRRRLSPPLEPGIWSLEPPLVGGAPLFILEPGAWSLEPGASPRV
jgi:hypothetical protein